MSALTLKEKVAAFVAVRKVQIAGLAGTAVLVAAASAGNLSNSLSPVITDVTDLIPLLYGMIIAFVPLIILMLVIDFFTGIFGGILGKFKM